MLKFFKMAEWAACVPSPGRNLPTTLHPLV